MRLIYSSNNPNNSQVLSNFLSSKGIQNQLELNTNTDWGSSNYGDVLFKIWIVEEDDLSAAMQFLEIFEKDPNDPIFHRNTSPLSLPPLVTKHPIKPDLKVALNSRSNAKNENAGPLGSINIVILLTCICIFFVSQFTTPNLSISTLPSTIPLLPLYSSPIKKELYYDYPRAFEILDKLVKLYGIEKLQNPQALPPEGKLILKEFYHTPYWQGFYQFFLQRSQFSKSQDLVASPLFEKIKKGEVWRAFTPSLLHSDALHLLFNMLWLIVLGKQMEQRVNKGLYISFILFAGIFSNTFQYLMSGSNFIGFSGILCAMLTFIWMRQRVAPWEGYPLQKSTFTFMLFFIFAMFFIQTISFYLEFDQRLSISPGVANTAHLAGAFIGAVLGRLPFFSWKI